MEAKEKTLVGSNCNEVQDTNETLPRVEVLVQQPGDDDDRGLSLEGSESGAFGT